MKLQATVSAIFDPSIRPKDASLSSIRESRFTNQKLYHHAPSSANNVPSNFQNRTSFSICIILSMMSTVLLTKALASIALGLYTPNTDGFHCIAGFPNDNGQFGHRLDKVLFRLMFGLAAYFDCKATRCPSRFEPLW